LVAWRLTEAIGEHNRMDAAQFAFQPGKNLHEAVNTTINAYEQSKSAPNNGKHRELYAIYYDISKAYDCTRWSSIDRALKRIGCDQDLVDYVLNSLKGSTVAMKVDGEGRITPRIELQKSIKQGCPLAPILFAIVMDELHEGYRNIGGYLMKGGKIVSSRGYCDDTMVMAGDWNTIKRMNTYTREFFE
jgi:hypothetical protein